MLTIDRWIGERARSTPDRVAIDFLGREVTYAELNARADELAQSLTFGERVATLTGNSPEHVALFFACAKAGASLVPISWRLSPHEIAFQLDDAQPGLFLVEDDHADLAERALALASVSPALEPGTGRPGSPAANDPLLLIYTSGTTGRPKGAVLTHANCFWTNVSLDLVTGMTGDDVVLGALPQHHVGGWNVQPLLAWWKGARVVLERTFDPARALALIEEKGITAMLGVPATYLFMAQDAGFERADLSSLRRAIVGGAPMPEALLETWRDRGVEIMQGYGLTEAAPNVLCLPPEDAMRKLGSVGRPYPYVEVALRELDGADLVDGDGEGELVVRGPNVFAGYWRNEEATRAAFDGGWLRTGDIAARDEEGYYRIRSRLKEMYISGGENVYPAEVESVLHEHVAVSDAAVVGVPHERWGEVGVAFVVVATGTRPDAEDLIAHCRERLAHYKVPHDVRFVEVLPRSAVNKVLKEELRAMLEGVSV